MSKFFYNIADKNAYFLINRKILVTRDTKTNASIGWLQTRHNRLVWMKILSVKPRKTDGFHSDVIKLLSQNSEVLRILIYTRLKINKK